MCSRMILLTVVCFQITSKTLVDGIRRGALDNGYQYSLYANPVDNYSPGDYQTQFSLTDQPREPFPSPDSRFQTSSMRDTRLSEFPITNYRDTSSTLHGGADTYYDYYNMNNGRQYAADNGYNSRRSPFPAIPEVHVRQQRRTAGRYQSRRNGLVHTAPVGLDASKKRDDYTFRFHGVPKSKRMIRNRFAFDQNSRHKNGHELLSLTVNRYPVVDHSLPGSEFARNSEIQSVHRNLQTGSFSNGFEMSNVNQRSKAQSRHFSYQTYAKPVDTYTSDLNVGYNTNSKFNTGYDLYSSVRMRDPLEGLNLPGLEGTTTTDLTGARVHVQPHLPPLSEVASRKKTLNRNSDNGLRTGHELLSALMQRDPLLNANVQQLSGMRGQQRASVHDLTQLPLAQISNVDPLSKLPGFGTLLTKDTGQRRTMLEPASGTSNPDVHSSVNKDSVAYLPHQSGNVDVNNLYVKQQVDIVPSLTNPGYDLDGTPLKDNTGLKNKPEIYPFTEPDLYIETQARTKVTRVTPPPGYSSKTTPSENNNLSNNGPSQSTTKTSITHSTISAPETSPRPVTATSSASLRPIVTTESSTSSLRHTIFLSTSTHRPTMTKSTTSLGSTTALSSKSIPSVITSTTPNVPNSVAVYNANPMLLWLQRFKNAMARSSGNTTPSVRRNVSQKQQTQKPAKTEYIDTPPIRRQKSGQQVTNQQDIRKPKNKNSNETILNTTTNQNKSLHSNVQEVEDIGIHSRISLAEEVQKMALRNGGTLNNTKPRSFFNPRKNNITRLSLPARTKYVPGSVQHEKTSNNRISVTNNNSLLQDQQLLSKASSPKSDERSYNPIAAVNNKNTGISQTPSSITRISTTPYYMPNSNWKSEKQNVLSLVKTTTITPVLMDNSKNKAKGTQLFFGRRSDSNKTRLTLSSHVSKLINDPMFLALVSDSQNVRITL